MKDQYAFPHIQTTLATSKYTRQMREQSLKQMQNWKKVEAPLLTDDLTKGALAKGAPAKGAPSSRRR
jgi:hypothetical protein